MDWVAVLRWLFSTLIVGGALWKGLEAVANVLAKRADAVNATRRIEIEQMQANYNNAMDLIEKQALRIDSLHKDITGCEKYFDEREMKYLARINALEEELSKVKQDYRELMSRYRKLENEYNKALSRIEKLEKGDTGPLIEP